MAFQIRDYENTKIFNQTAHKEEIWHGSSITQNCIGPQYSVFSQLPVNFEIICHCHNCENEEVQTGDVETCKEARENQTVFLHKMIFRTQQEFSKGQWQGNGTEQSQCEKWHKQFWEVHR